MSFIYRLIFCWDCYCCCDIYRVGKIGVFLVFFNSSVSLILINFFLMIVCLLKGYVCLIFFVFMLIRVLGRLLVMIFLIGRLNDFLEFWYIMINIIVIIIRKRERELNFINRLELIMRMMIIRKNNFKYYK